ncbi:MAG: hypothetical protein EZS28_051386, partial [Streblomastix strix]
MKDIDPAADAADRTGMGACAWKEEYTTDCNRFDSEHQMVLLYLALACGCINSELNVKDKIDELKKHVDNSTKRVIEEVENICNEIEENAGALGTVNETADHFAKAQATLTTLAMLTK